MFWITHRPHTHLLGLTLFWLTKVGTDCVWFEAQSATPVANFSTILASVVDTGGKFATGVNDTGGKCATGVNDAGGKLPPVSGCRHLKVNLKAKIYIYVNSTTQRCPNKIIKIFLWRFFPFATGVVDTGGKPWAAKISANFWKNLKRP